MAISRKMRSEASMYCIWVMVSSLGLVSVRFNSMSPTLIDAPFLRSADMTVTESLMSFSLEMLPLLQLNGSKVRPLPWLMLMFSLAGRLADIKLSKDAASSPCCCRVESRLEARAVGTVAAADDVVSFAVVTLLAWWSMASGPTLGAFD